MLESAMDELFDRQKSDLLGKVRDKLRRTNEKVPQFLNSSLP